MTQNTKKPDLIDNLFPRSYPIKRQTRKRFSLPTPDKWPMMQVHVTRSHFGEILIAAASTGQNGLPDRFRENDHYHKFPTYGGDSWKTRFDSGRDGGQPQVVAALYVTQGEPNSNDETHWTELDKVYVKIVVNVGLPVEHYVELYANDWVLNDDGLEMMHAALKCVDGGRNKIDMKDIPNYVLESLHWATNHIEDSFGQGKIPRKRN